MVCCYTGKKTGATPKSGTLSKLKRQMEPLSEWRAWKTLRATWKSTRIPLSGTCLYKHSRKCWTYLTPRSWYVLEVNAVSDYKQRFYSLAREHSVIESVPDRLPPPRRWRDAEIVHTLSNLRRGLDCIVDTVFESHHMVWLSLSA